MAETHFDEQTAANVLLSTAEFWQEILRSRIDMLREAQTHLVEGCDKWAVGEALIALGEQAGEAFSGVMACVGAGNGRAAWILARTTFMAHVQALYVATDQGGAAKAARGYLEEGQGYLQYIGQRQMMALSDPETLGNLRELGIDPQRVASTACQEAAKGVPKLPVPSNLRGQIQEIAKVTGGEQDLDSLEYDVQFRLLSAAAHAAYHGRELKANEVLDPLCWSMMQVGRVCGILSGGSDCLHEHTKQLFVESQKDMIRIWSSVTRAKYQPSPG